MGLFERRDSRHRRTFQIIYAAEWYVSIEYFAVLMKLCLCKLWTFEYI